MDYYEAALQKLRADKTPLTQLGERTGVRWETIRNIKYGRSKRFFYQTVQQIAHYYYPDKVRA